MLSFKRIIVAALALAALLYPAFVYWGMQHFEPKYIGLAAAMIFCARVFFVSNKKRIWLLSCFGFIAFAILLWLFNHAYLLLFIPALISLGFMGGFIYSCLHPPSVVARIATKLDGPLCEKRLHYTNIVMRIWIAFFAFNAVAASYTALFSSREVWALYTGLISYVLIGLLFLGEFTYRALVLEPQLQKEHGRQRARR